MADFSFIRSASNQADPASATFGGTPTSGNLLIAVASDRSGGTADNFTISGSGWTKRVSRTIQQANGTYRRTLVVWEKVAGSSEPTNVQVDDGTANTKALLIAEFQADVAGTWTFVEAVSNDNSTTSNATTIATGTTGSISAGDNLLIGCGGIKWGELSDATTAAWTSINLTNDAYITPTSFGRGHAIGHAKDTGAGTKASTMTISTGDTTNDGLAAAMLVFSFTTAGGGAGRARYLPLLGVG